MLHGPIYFPLWLAMSLAGIFGLCIGSFINVVVHRLPRMMESQLDADLADLMAERGWLDRLPELAGQVAEAAKAPFNLSVPRSRCPSCGHGIAAVEDIPVLSWIFLRGRCSACKLPISARYPMVELLTGGLSVLLAWRFGISWACLAGLVFTWALVALTFLDISTMTLPDEITLPLLWLGLGVNLFDVIIDLQSAVIGAVVGYAVLWVVAGAYRLATGKEGMGKGDFKLLAAICAFLGWQMLPLVFLLSTFGSAVVGVSMIVMVKHGRHVPIPFGPFLAGAGFFAMIWGVPITRNLLGII